MNSRIIILAVSVLSLASCSTAYRTGQTPDDVYYSPVRERDEYVVVDRNDNRRYDNNNDRYYYDSDDNYLRMMSRNRYRWSAFNDYYWMDSRPFIGFNTGWSYNPFYNPWSFNGFYPNYWTWNNWYNPYGQHYVVVNPVKNPNVYSRLKTFNAGSYTNPNYSNSNRRYGNFSKGTVRPTYNNSNSNRNNNQLGTSIKKVFSNPDRQYNNNSSYDRPVRTYNPSNSNTNSYSPSRSSSSSSSSSSSGSSGGGGSTGSRPGRGN